MQPRRQQGALIPLSAESKSSYVNALTAIDHDKLQAALIQIAMAPESYDFPLPMKTNISTLQLALQQNRHNPKMCALLEAAMIEHITSEGTRCFAQLIRAPINEAHWQSEFLQSLANVLNIRINLPPIVQATIKAGKIYWRLLQNDAVIYDRHQGKNEGIVFTPENSWLTDWRQFRKFKDSGKRFSPIRITKQRYIAAFENEKFHVFAGKIWDEFKQLGILTAKDRISHGWRALFNHDVKLQAVEDVKLKTKKATQANKILLYDLVISNLEKVANNPLLAEKVNGFPEYGIFRPERTNKNWASTGKITNDSPKNAAHCTKLWDVGTYEELTQHRHSGEETKLYGEILNYDHIPSKSALKNNPSPALKAHTEEVKALNALQQQILAQRMNDTGHITRGAPLALAKSHEDELNVIQNLGKVKSAFVDEAEKWALTIAIPEKLHHAGETFMESASSQKKFTGHVFTRDVTAHLENIQEAPEKYALKHPDDTLRAIGAMRYLYHAECKPPAKMVARDIYLGRISHGFFQPPTVKADLDKLFIEKMQNHMKKR